MTFTNRPGCKVRGRRFWRIHRSRKNVLSATNGLNTSNASLYIPYMIIGGVVVVLAIAFIFSKIPEINAEEEVKSASSTSAKSMWKRKHFTLAALAQFFYVAAQSCIFSFFINYFVENSGVADRTASNWLAIGGFGLFFLGRFSGSMALRRLKAHSTLAVYSFINVALMALVPGETYKP